MSDNIMENIEGAAGQPFHVNIVDNVMHIAPAEAGIAIFAALTKGNESEEAAWQEADQLAKALEQARDDNARLRDLFESVHPTLVELGQTELADLLMREVYPIYGVDADGTETRIG